MRERENCDPRHELDTTAPRDDQGVSRRGFLGGLTAGALGAASCSSGPPEAPPRTAPPQPVPQAAKSGDRLQLATKDATWPKMIQALTSKMHRLKRRALGRFLQGQA